MPIRDEKKRTEYQKNYKRKEKRIRSLSNSHILNKSYLCFDGETENDKYTLLGHSTDYIYNAKGLSSVECLNFLYYQGKGCIKVIFAIHFDVQHWIKDLANEEILDLLNGETVEYAGYELSYITKRFLSISIEKKRVYIYDICSFFQTSLLKTIENMKITLSVKQKRILERGKVLRANNFNGMTKKDIIEYNQTECIITERICYKLREILMKCILHGNGRDFNLYPSRFYGSGAIAKKILKVLGMQIHKEREDVLTDKIKKYIYLSYFGGRAECFKIGTFENLYKYDINSAYPDVLRQLTLPVRYKIKKINRTVSEYNFIDKNIYHIEFDFTKMPSNLIGILPIRRKDGYVMFPKRGRGYYYGVECKYLNNMSKYGIGFFNVKSVLEIEYTDSLIFESGFIENIYTKRLELKEKGDISNIAYKLSMNAIYGKFAQQTGKREFTNILFASYITAYTRGKILSVLFENNSLRDVVQISTDGIFTQKELTTIPCDNGIGNWDKEFYKKAIILGSGLYGLYGKKETFALRGIFVSKENFLSIYNTLKNKSVAVIKYKCFIGHKFALANYKAYGNFRLKFSSITKSISPFTYEKRLFKNKNPITKITTSLWFDMFDITNKKIDSCKLKKFELNLEDEAIEVQTK